MFSKTQGKSRVTKRYGNIRGGPARLFSYGRKRKIQKNRVALTKRYSKRRGK